MTETVLAGGLRTGLGAFGGSLSRLDMTDVAGRTAAACVASAGIAPEKVDHIVFTTTVPS